MHKDKALRRPWLILTTVVAVGMIFSLPQLVSADRSDPLPSPLYQHSLSTSIENFDGEASYGQNNKPRRQRDGSIQSGSGSFAVSPATGNNIVECCQAELHFNMALGNDPNACQSPSAAPVSVFGTAVVERAPPPYVDGQTIPIEIVSMELVGIDPFGGTAPLVVREREDRTSQGSVEGVVTDGNGGFVSGTNSFFDIYIRIERGSEIIETEIIELHLESTSPIPVLPPFGTPHLPPPGFEPIPLTPPGAPSDPPEGWLCDPWFDPGYILPGAAPWEQCSPPPSQPTYEGFGSCHGAATCDGFYTCMNATCAAIQTCQAITCTAEPTCAGSEFTCSGNATCPWYPTCAETPTCLTETCVGWLTCRGSATCPGTPTCDPPPTYDNSNGCEQPTMTGSASCHGTATCPGSHTCVDASCAAFQTCINPTCTSEATCSANSNTCSYTPTCAEYPSCEGTATCGSDNLTCIGSETCQGSTTCEGTTTCEPPAPTQDGTNSCEGVVTCDQSPTCPPGCGMPTYNSEPSCDNTISCDHTPTCGFSCDGQECDWPTSQGWFSCQAGGCPTASSQASCPGWRCPTFPGSYSCPAADCVTLPGAPSCPGGPVCETMAGFLTCGAECIPPTSPGIASCRPADCITWIGSFSCPGHTNCPLPTVDGNPSCGSTPTCANNPCPPPTIPGMPTCVGIISCAPNPTCNPFGNTCAGFQTCAPNPTCQAGTCRGVNTCPGFATCAQTATCQQGHTCSANITCQNAATCTGVTTCDVNATCAPNQTCGVMPTCSQVSCLQLTCQFVATCSDAQPTCNGSSATCSGGVTCTGSPTCELAFTCGGWPTCQPPPIEVPCRLKLCIDSVRYGWVDPFFAAGNTTPGFAWDDWHGGAIHPLLIWDEMSPKFAGDFVITEWYAPPPEAGVIDTELVKYVDTATITRHVDSDGDLHISPDDYLKVHLLLLNQETWYRVDASGKSRPNDLKFIVRLVCENPALAGACACDCFADPANCEGIVNVFDVVVCVDEAFRGGPAIIDPNPNCPYTDNDVNCDNVVNVFDVVALVDVAFRGADPLATFCDPCP